MSTPVSAKELREVLAAYKKANGNKTNAADLLGMNRSTFYNRLQIAFREFGKPEIVSSQISVLSDDLLREAIEVYKKSGGNKQRAADMMGMKRSAFSHRLKVAMNKFGTTKPVAEVADIEVLDGTIADDTEVGILKSRVRQLEALIKSSKKETLDEEMVRRVIIGLSEQDPELPAWMVRTSSGSESTGVPTLFASDWHWGEVVDPNQVNRVNEYNIAIAQDRARTMVETTIQLLKQHIKHKDYPGIVFALGGDMVSGDIHEELSVSNELDIMPTVLDLWATLAWCIETLANEFGNVFVPCVTGNHGRNTHKIRAKGRNFTSFDWLVYHFLAKRFEGDERIRFRIPDGSDCHYNVYGHRYLLTHGDQFRGGDGMIGALGPIIRGDHKKRSRNSQIDMDYDTLLLGHWHQLIQLQRLIVNGSLKGYDEYAYQGNFPFEPPRQALWITHERYGITFSAPVMVERPKVKQHNGWVSWK